MINAAIFFLHIIFALIIFTKKWQDESLSSAFQNLLLIIILFSVGWPISTMIVKIFADAEGLGIYFNRDAIVLSVLTIGEFFFYRVYYKREFFIEAGTEK
ncbi:MAG: hypothetical protein PVH88_02435 [Ignavibacteria bacterium]|jgi:hypothetical protein